MRVRETGPINSQTSFTFDGGTLSPGVVSTNTFPEGERKYVTMSDVEVPDFHKRVANGEVFFNPMTRWEESSRLLYPLKWKCVYKDGRYFYFDGDVSAEFCGDTPASLFSHPDYDYHIGIAKSRALANINASEYGFMEDVAEIGSTLKFIRNPIKGITDVLKDHQNEALRWQAKKGLNSLHDAMRDTYLSYRFAYTPLVRSVNDAIESTTKKIQVRPDRETARGKSKYEYEDTYIGCPVIFNKEVEVRGSWKGVARATILYKVNNSPNSWAKKYGLRFQDVPKTAWALTPYSFMIDRVWNITDAIEGLTQLANPNVQLLGACTAIHAESNYTVSGHRHLPDPNWSYIYESHGAKEFYYSYKERNPWSPTAMDAIPPPAILGLVDSSTKMFDLLALSTQRLKR